MTTKTYAQLGTFASVSGTFLIAGWDPAGPGPLKTATASIWRTYFQANLGTASLADTGTSGDKVAKTNGANTWSAAQTFSVTATGNLIGNVTGNLTGNVTGNVTGSSGSCTGNAATASTATTVTDGAITPAKCSTGHPTWDSGGNLAVPATLTAQGEVQAFGGDMAMRVAGANRIMDFSVVGDHRWQFNDSTGTLALVVNNVPVLSIDISGNVIAKGTITQNGTPIT